MQSHKSEMIASIALTKSVNVAPFVIKKIDKYEFITLPSNFTKLMEDDDWKAIATCINKMTRPLAFTERELAATPPSENLRLFIAGCFKRLEDLQQKEFKIKINTKTPIKRARMYIDTLVVAYKDAKAVKYLPKSMNDKGRSWLSSELSIKGGVLGTKALGGLGSLLTDYFKSEIVRIRDLIDMSRFGLSFSEVVGEIPRHKEKNIRDPKTKKVTKVSKPIHLLRPSKRSIVTSEYEKAHLQTLEAPWEAIKDLAEKYNVVVPSSNLDEVYDSYKTNYQGTFDVSAGLNTWESRKRQALQLIGTYGLSKKAAETYVYKASDVDKMFDTLAEIYSEDPSLFKKIIMNMHPKLLFKNEKAWVLLSFGLIEKYLNKTINADKLQEITHIGEPLSQYITEVLDEIIHAVDQLDTEQPQSNNG